MEWKAVYAIFGAMFFYIAPVGVMVVAVWIGRRIHYRRDRKNPISKDLLRGPGHTLGKELEDVRHDFLTYIAVAAPLPLFFLASWYLLQVSQSGRSASFPLIFTLVLIGGAGWLAHKLIGLTKRIRDLSLGLEAETAVGQELNQLLRDGYDVFHDVDGDRKFNIDHVVVGRSGVFAIETKGRSKPIRNGKAEYKVQLDGDQLIFPGWVETEPLVQAKRNAEWLAKWLSSATGDAVTVKPVLILPGWWIDRKTPYAVAVLSAGSCRQAIPKLGVAPLSEQQVRRIAHQLDAKCRDVAPRKNA